jgi:hypothetical protein
MAQHICIFTTRCVEFTSVYLRFLIVLDEFLEPVGEMLLPWDDLETSHRNKDDACLAHFLREARGGALSWTMYNFIHGYETCVPGSWLPAGDGVGVLTCGSALCEKLWKVMWPQLFKEGHTGAQLMDMECGGCKKERKRCNRLIEPGEHPHLATEFASAPYIHPFNEPKTLVFLIRAVHYAQVNHRQLVWCTAVDEPSTRDDETRTAESLRNARRRWLLYSETKTNGIVGILPLSEGLPVRFTDNVAIDLGACKHSCGTVVGWSFDSSVGTGAEVASTALPRVIYVRVKGATWTLDERLGEGVLPVRPKTAAWERGPGASVRRTGYQLVPNLGGTAHSFTGSTLDAGIVDLPRSYVAISLAYVTRRTYSWHSPYLHVCSAWVRSQGRSFCCDD